MKPLYVFILLFYALNVSVHAQADSIPKMSVERADSLLKSLSVTRGKTVTHTTRIVPQTDTLPETDLSTDADSLPIADTLPDTALLYDTLFSDDTAGDVDLSPASEITAPQTIDTISRLNDMPEHDRNRKKAHVAYSDLLIRQEEIGLTETANVDYNNIRSVNEATLIGAGGYKMRDKYLSELDYGGIGVRLTNERMRLIGTNGYKFSRQNMVTIDISSVLNGAENANFLSAFANYSMGYHYRLMLSPYLKLLLGGSIRGMLGMVYNTRNGNNPMTVHADVDLNLSLAGIYDFSIHKNHFAFRYQIETPFLGVLFSPVYNQSYYEIFSLGNTAEIFNFNSFNNKFALYNYLTLDIPLGGMTVRVGYLGYYYSTNIHNIDRYIISNNILIGFVKEFASFGGREMRRRNLFNSAYY